MIAVMILNLRVLNIFPKMTQPHQLKIVVLIHVMVNQKVEIVGVIRFVKASETAAMIIFPSVSTMFLICSAVKIRVTHIKEVILILAGAIQHVPPWVTAVMIIAITALEES